AAYHFTLSRVLSHQKKHDEAERVLKAIIETTPDDPTPWSRLAWSRWRAERYDEAAEAAREALWRDPALPYPHYLLGWIAQHRDDRESAIAHFRRYLELDPKDVEGATLALSNLGAAPAPETAPIDYMKRIYATRAAFWDENVTSRTRYRA